MALVGTQFISVLLLHFFFAISASFVFPDVDQTLLSTVENTSQNRSYSIGFSLQSSFGAAAVIIKKEDGQMETHTLRMYHLLPI